MAALPPHDEREIHSNIGDFNGDQRADLLCHRLATETNEIAYREIAFANYHTGFFDQPIWGNYDSWCSGLGTELRIGDFNGDRRDDLLCHDSATGAWWIDYADPMVGTFGVTDWSSAPADQWCIGNDVRLYVGKLNNDKYEDLLCHDMRTGVRRIALADVYGRFRPNATAQFWTATSSWCTGDSLHIH